MKETHPEQIGKYEVVDQIGQGAMGMVYKAFDPIIKRDVAIKAINKKILQNQEVSADEIMARFKREAQAAGRLNHPNIVSIFDYIEEAESAFIVMEIVNGRELKSYFDNQEKFIEQSYVVSIMEQLLSALAHSHEHGVIHRDIKPANIIVMENRQIKVTDFGIANLESSELTQVGTMMGTPSYMSPEQVRGEKVGLHSDLFSAGVIFYQLLTGEKPFYGQSMTTVMHKVLHETPVAPSLLSSQIPSGFDEIIEKVLNKDPLKRYRSANFFKKAISSAFFAKDRLYSHRSESPGERPLTDETVLIGSLSQNSSAVDKTVLISGNDAFKKEQGDPGDSATSWSTEKTQLIQTQEVGGGTFASQDSHLNHTTTQADPKAIEKNLSSRKYHRKYALLFIFSIVLLSWVYIYFINAPDQPDSSLKQQTGISHIYSKPESDSETSEVKEEEPPVVAIESKPKVSEVREDEKAVVTEEKPNIQKGSEVKEEEPPVMAIESKPKVSEVREDEKAVVAGEKPNIQKGSEVKEEEPPVMAIESKPKVSEVREDEKAVVAGEKPNIQKASEPKEDARPVALIEPAPKVSEVRKDEKAVVTEGTSNIQKASEPKDMNSVSNADEVLSEDVELKDPKKFLEKLLQKANETSLGDKPVKEHRERSTSKPQQTEEQSDADAFLEALRALSN